MRKRDNVETTGLLRDSQEALVPKGSSDNGLAVWASRNAGELSVREAGELLASLWSRGGASGRMPYGTSEAKVWIDSSSDPKFRYSADGDVISIQAIYACGKVEIDKKRFGKMRLSRNGEIVTPERCDTLSLSDVGFDVPYERVILQSKAYEWKLLRVDVTSKGLELAFVAKEDEWMFAWGSVRLKPGEDIYCLERRVGGEWCPYIGLANCILPGEQRGLFRRVMGPRHTMLATRIYSVSHSESDVVKTFAVTGDETTLLVDASGKAFKEEVRRIKDYTNHDVHHGAYQLKF